MSEEQTEIWRELKELFQTAVKDEKPIRMRVLKDIFKSAVGMARDSPGTMNLKIAATTIKELRHSFRMFYPHRFTPKITMFGSARVSEDSPLYEQAREFASEAVKANFMIMTGGGPGIMAAGNEGAESKGGFGLNIRLPLEQDPNPFIDWDTNLLNYKYFFTRKLFMVKEASAFAFFPGGFGTFDEAFEVLTLLQTGKTDLIPVVMMQTKNFGYWDKFMEFYQEALVDKGFVSESDHTLFTLCHDPREAMQYIQDFYRVYHSQRYVAGNLVFRLKQPISDETLSQIRKRFGDLSKDGKFEISGPLSQERNEPELAKLSRLVFPFLKKDFGTLRKLIDFINESAI